MNNRILFYLSALVILLGASTTALADVPQLINYQGVLLDFGGDPVVGPVDIVFAIYHLESGGESPWSESHSVEPDPDGGFNVLLGQTTPITDNILNQADCWLGIRVGADAEMNPRVRLASAPFAHRVSTVDGSTGGIISGDVSIQSDLDLDGDLRVTGKATIGPSHTNAGPYAFVAGKENQSLSGGYYSTISGGEFNVTDHYHSTIGGGEGNAATGTSSTVSGGEHNTADAPSSTVAGGRYNFADHYYTSVGGGDSNYAAGFASTVGGGHYDTASGYCSTVGGGMDNDATGDWSTVGGGYKNLASLDHATVGGGESNVASGARTTIAGGEDNYVSEFNGAIGGGWGNRVEGSYSCIPGGERDTVTGDHSMAFGYGVYNSHDDAALFYDGSNPGHLYVNRDRRDEGMIVFLHPLRVGTNTGNGNGAYLSEGGTWTNGSSRAFKENFQPLDGEELLAKIAALPVEAWNYKGTNERHIGPVSEDFVAAFDVGTAGAGGARENKYLSHGDVAGVALAAIQALNTKNNELEKRVAELQSLVQKLLANQE